MVENKLNQNTLPAMTATLEEMGEFWDTHDTTEYEGDWTPVEIQVVAHPRHEYVITLSDTLNTALHRVQQQEGVPLNTLVNLWIQEKLQALAG